MTGEARMPLAIAGNGRQTVQTAHHLAVFQKMEAATGNRRRPAVDRRCGRMCSCSVNDDRRRRIETFVLWCWTSVKSFSCLPGPSYGCHRMSATHNSTKGWVTFGQNCGCSLWSRSVLLGSAERENTPGQLNVKLFFSSFPTNVITVLQRQGQTDGRTNRRLAVAMPRSATSA